MGAGFRGGQLVACGDALGLTADVVERDGVNCNVWLALIRELVQLNRASRSRAGRRLRGPASVLVWPSLRRAQG